MNNASLLEKFEYKLAAAVSNLDYQSKKLSESVNYSVTAGGKRFRPNLMFSSAQMLGVEPELMFDLAIAIELIHTYSLIHDDLPCLDDDDMRRGMKTNHIVFGEDTALLAGDVLQSIAFEKVYDAINNGFDPLVLKYFAMSCRKMVEGQALDTDDSYKTSIDKLENVHLLKTGALIEFCVIAPLFYLKAYDNLDDFAKIGKIIGLSFQIKDDILDVTSTKEMLGKSNSDSENNKTTYVTMLGQEECESMLNAKLNEVDDILKSLSVDSKYFTEIIDFSLNRIK